jgi:hypothetical protein
MALATTKYDLYLKASDLDLATVAKAAVALAKPGRGLLVSVRAGAPVVTALARHELQRFFDQTGFSPDDWRWVPEFPSPFATHEELASMTG